MSLAKRFDEASPSSPTEEKTSPAQDRTADAPSETSAESGEAPAQQATWYLRTPEGQTYGPVAKSELDAWLAEGRVAGDCHLRDGAGNWRGAADVYPSLGSATTSSYTAKPTHSNAPQGSGYSPQPGGYAPQSGGYVAQPGGYAPQPSGYSQQPAAYSGAGQNYSPFAAPQIQASYATPHRGGVILVLAIIGMMVCPIFSVAAWVMGSNDLRDMRAGRMDRSGMGLTQAGQILGMVISIIGIIGALFCMFILMIGVAAG